ncbi:hypothetical protein PAXRUDRAFT_18972 [Paxillus rubicundulus Ve08.2h10]|uniref:Uncharacterized protein n=1 Tax=Paxillus rubicundulus Ve08.2h10 TaxID=930991 RepID=A0A0D0D5Z4_9AGAM|nr:hypothetical protein PAXRUDRAFT_18972 [Paxillus rubicundulus Ve08.2h10]
MGHHHHYHHCCQAITTTVTVDGPLPPSPPPSTDHSPSHHHRQAITTLTIDHFSESTPSLWPVLPVPSHTPRYLYYVDLQIWAYPGHPHLCLFTPWLPFLGPPPSWAPVE